MSFGAREVGLAILVACCVACSGTERDATGPSPETGSKMDEIAESYVRLVLAVGHHDEDYVDAYYGPPEWAEQADEITTVEIRERAGKLIERLAQEPADETDEMSELRRSYLEAQLRAQLEASLVGALHGDYGVHR